MKFYYLSRHGEQALIIHHLLLFLMLFQRNSSTKTEDEKSCGCSRKGSLFTGIIVGGAVGSVLSLLFAPDKGENTRAKIAKKSQDLINEGKTKAEEFLEKYKKD